MRNPGLLILLLPLAWAKNVSAGSYMPQASFNLPIAGISGLDSDSVGNLYVLGQPSAGGTYSVSEYRTQGIEPLLSFNTGLSSPTAFAVEPSGIVDVLDGSGGLGAIVLKRFQNNGALLSSTSYSIANPFHAVFWTASAIDKANQRVYLAYQYWYEYICVQCTGCYCPPSGYRGFINQYDFQGNLLNTVTMPGISATLGSCYTASKMTTDPQGNVYVADAVCQHVLKYSSSGSLANDAPASNWSSSFGPRALWTDASSNLYISQSVCGLTGCAPGIIKLSGSALLQNSFLANAAVGCAWDDRILYLGAAGSFALKRFIFDNPPTVPTETAPLGPTLQHSNLAGLNWQSSNDPDGDPITYSVSLGQAPNQLVPLGTTGQTALATSALGFGTTYYWQAIAQDSYLGLPLLQQPAPVVSFNLDFTNNPPGPFGMLSGAGTTITRSASVILSWQVSQDPDGDSVVYDLYWRPAQQSTASLIVSTPATSWTMTGLGFGATYYWSVRAQDPYGATTSMSGGEQAYYPVFKNSPPPAPTISSGTGVSSQHTLSPQEELAWSSVLDPDGDPVSYRLDINTATGTWTVSAGSVTSLMVSALFETTFYWRVTALDPFGGASTGTWQNFIVHLTNQPPYPIVYSSSSTLLARTTSYALTWQDTGDPDGDPTTYAVYLSTNPSAQYLVQQGTQTAYLLNLEFGTTYYWRVSAMDNFGARTDGALETFVSLFTNSSPEPFSVLTGTGTMSTRTSTATLSWQPAVDLDGDRVTYALWVSSNAATLAPVQTSSATAYLLNFQFNTTYYWRVDAYDGYGASTTIAGGVQSFYPVFLNDPPPSLTLSAPFVGAPLIKTMQNQVVMSWDQVTTPQGDPASYTVYWGDSPSALETLTTINPTVSVDGSIRIASRPALAWPKSQVDLQGNKVQLTLTGLSFYKTYYLQISASSPYGATSQTPLQNFTLTPLSGFPKAYNYPNPFNPNHGGTHIVFNAPPSGYAKAKVSVYSELQDLLFEQEYGPIAPGISQVDFSGRDRYGHALFNGSYICRVQFYGPNDEEIFYLLAVK